MDLISKKCVPCEGGAEPLPSAEAEELLSHVKDWKFTDGKKIEKDFTFKNFKEAMRFVNKVADLAEIEGHHPDIILYGWNKVRLELSTHTIGGLSENDFILAAKIDTIMVA